MSEPKKLEDVFKEVVTGDALKDALDFVEFVNAGEMIYSPPHEIHYKGERVCYVDTSNERSTWTIWTDGDYSSECKGFPIDGQTKEIARKHANKCGNCEDTNCSPGKTAIIFGNEFTNICSGAHVDMCFTNPAAEALDGLKKLLEMRKYIIDNHAM